MRDIAKSRRNSVVGPAVGGKGKGKLADKPVVRNGTLLLCSAELCPGHALQDTDDTFHGIIPGISEHFKDMIRLAAERLGENDVFCIGDGRSDSARRQIRDFLTSAVGGDQVTQLWIMKSKHH